MLGLGGLSVTLTSTLLQCHHNTETALVSVHNDLLIADNYSVFTVKGLVQKWHLDISLIFQCVQ